MVAITFHGGVNEIGGNKVLIEDGDTRIFLDFGMSFAERSKFYSGPWLSPRDERGLLRFGILPEIEGVYRFDETPPSVDAVFLSHSHADHSMHASFLKREIPIYCGRTASSILQAVNESRPRMFETDLSEVSFRTFKTGDRIKVGSIEVEPVHVDHSVPSSYGFIVHTSDGPIVYSGDFRVHGSKPELTRDFVKAASRERPVAMLCEGTNMIGGNLASEEDVRAKLERAVTSTSKLVVGNFTHTDVDRWKSFLDVARSSGRQLAISLKQAHMLDVLHRDGALGVPSPQSDELLIYRRAKKTYYEWEKRLLGYSNVVDAEDVRKRQDKVILAPFTDPNELIQIAPEPGSCFVLSLSEPFNEEMELEYDRFINWLDHFGLPMYHIHCSGHIMPNDIKAIVSEIRPKKFFPIHTDHPHLYASFMSQVTSVQLPTKGARTQVA